MSRLERIFYIDHQIRAHAYPNADAIVAQFEVSRRQVYQDYAYMRDRLHAPIAYDHARKGWRYTDSTFALPAMHLRQAELLAFLLAGDLSQRYLGTPFEAAFTSALDKIREYLPDHMTVSAESLHRIVAVTGSLEMAVDPQHLLALLDAVAQHRRVRLRYYSPRSNEETERTVDPYHLHNVRGAWYLIAWCHLRQGIRDFSVGRIHECVTLDEEFARASGFLLEEYLKTGFVAERDETPVEVVLRFDAYQSRWIQERKYHSTQTLKENPDGSLELRMWTGGLEEVARWALGFGPHVEVLGPPELRERVAEWARETARIYG
jgi:predicted DNA-binding transcriptional regulator YafY